MKINLIVLSCLMVSAVACSQKSSDSSVLKNTPKDPASITPGAVESENVPEMEEAPSEESLETPVMTDPNPEEEPEIEEHEESLPVENDEGEPQNETPSESENNEEETETQPPTESPEVSWSLKEKIQEILDRIENTPATIVSFDEKTQTAKLDRNLTDLEILAGALLTEQVVREIDEFNKGSAASDFLKEYLGVAIGHALYCSNSKQKTVPSVDGRRFIISKDKGDYILIDEETHERQDVTFKQFKAACTYVIKDLFAIKHISNTGLDFPLVYSKNGTIQSALGVVRKMFCERNLKETDGLDSVRVCE